jgi:hypothetical protein
VGFPGVCSGSHSCISKASDQAQKTSHLVDNRGTVVPCQPEAHGRVRSERHVPRVILPCRAVVDGHLERLPRGTSWAGVRRLHVHTAPRERCGGERKRREGSGEVHRRRAGTSPSVRCQSSVIFI